MAFVDLGDDGMPSPGDPYIYYDGKDNVHAEDMNIVSHSGITEVTVAFDETYRWDDYWETPIFISGSIYLPEPLVKGGTILYGPFRSLDAEEPEGGGVIPYLESPAPYLMIILPGWYYIGADCDLNGNNEPDFDAYGDMIEPFDNLPERGKSGGPAPRVLR